MQDAQIDRMDVLQHFWKTISQCVHERIPLDKVIDKSWLNPERNTHEVLKEVMSISIMHERNLWSLKTEEAKQYYADNLDLPTALHIDLQSKKQIKMEQIEEKLERTFLVQCSKEKLIALGKWMNTNEIFFRKCSDGINAEAHTEIFPGQDQEKEADGPVRPQ